MEDDPAQGDALRKTLKAEGFAVEWVVTFAGAEEIIRLYKFDCILLDIALPDGNGEAILRSGVVTLSFSGWKGQRLVDIQATQAAIFHASKASSRW
ncbi:response regulator [Rhizobium ruizarguesonis]|uniref:response regulator n=1 Tax=Rhizobium ruizarguesonis TaxID=2081791 RepID=UPI00247AAC99